MSSSTQATPPIFPPPQHPPAANLPPPSWTISESDYPDQACVHTLFEQFAAATPDAPALDSEKECLTYRELNIRANRVAHFLRSRGVGPDIPVAICTERSFAMVIGQLGILKAGGFYVPLDPSYPAERLAWMLRETRAPVLLTESHLRPILPSTTVEIVCLDDDSPLLARQSAENPARNTTAANLAYLIYTSGSTGLPKGASIPHRGISRLVRGQTYAPFGPAERFLVLASPSFDGIIFELWGALLNGGCCVIFTDRWPEFSRLEEVIRTLRVTCLWLTTGLFNQIIDYRPGTLATARHVLIGGEALSPRHVQRALQLLPEVRFLNGYGPTECTTFACVYPIAPPDQWLCDSVPIGGPINNTECHIVDEALRPVPVGEPGELLLGGPGLAREYFQRPELTSEKFIPNPFGTDPSSRLYRTGDRCRWLPNGLIEYLGRTDDQIKLRGFRIELGEITTALHTLPGVLNASVIARDHAGTKQLVAFAVPAPGATLSSADLRVRLGALLPEHCVPAFIHLVPQLPLTANGKVDRRRLAALAEPHPSVVAEPAKATPSGPLEETLLSLWRKVLEQPALGLHDSFFENGGDSLLSIQLALEIQRTLSCPVPIGSIYLSPSPAAFAKKLTAGLDDVSGHPLEVRTKNPPLFYIPGISGVCKLPDPLVQLIKDTHPYYDRLQYTGLDGTASPLASVEEIATEMIRQIRKVLPTGSFALCGYSMGGIVAHEIACQLHAAGETVEKLILWDSIPPPLINWRSAPGILGAMTRSILTSPLPALPGLIEDYADIVEQRIARRLSKYSPLKSPATPWPCASQKLATSEQRVASVSETAYYRYSPKSHATPAVLFRCKKSTGSVFGKYPKAPDHGWKRWILNTLAVHTVDCDHLDLLKEPSLSEVMVRTAAELQA